MVWTITDIVVWNGEPKWGADKYQTPNQLKMKYHCEINAMFYQMRGGSEGSARNTGADHGH
ncbi:hypothetical protein CRG98_041992 [Punica granatum]|uniref:Uncharacterized protein n=1 Tax=Punica granatum TaxID=22663 RepID=A0A2I0I142_PUNGR|nr:hypothetical protein CRG98_041992 [Punica granatum]